MAEPDDTDGDAPEAAPAWERDTRWRGSPPARHAAARDARGPRGGDASGALTHFDAEGRARMVDVGDKAVTVREATATGFVRMLPETARLIGQGGVKKGDVLAVAQVAGIQAAKRTWELVPLCHNIPLSGVELALETSQDPPGVSIAATVRTVGKTGAEMEALTAVSVAALTVYDMCKAVDRGMALGEIKLRRKSGGKSGTWEAAP